MQDWISDKTLLQIQAISGLGFASFSVLHLTNAITANGGHLLYDGAMEFFRLYYQNPVVEFVAVGTCLFLHTGSSILRILRRKPSSTEDENKGNQLPSLNDLHRFSGVILMGIMTSHIPATRFIKLESPPDFSMVNFSLETWPFIFYPYYFLLAFSGLYHTTLGITKAINRLKYSKTFSNFHKNPIYWGILSVIAIPLATSILSLGGIFFEPSKERFPEFRIKYEALTPSFLRPIILPWNSK